MIGLRSALDPETVRTNSERISRNLFACEEFKRSRHLMAYMSLEKEVQTDSIIKISLKMGKKVYLPVVDKNKKELRVTELPGLDIEFESGPFGIREPAEKELRWASPRVLDCVIIPGVAFDVNGGRLGFGGGYYDRLLKCLLPESSRVGVAFAFQVLDALPQREHDQKVRKLITENNTMDC